MSGPITIKVATTGIPETVGALGEFLRTAGNAEVLHADIARDAKNLTVKWLGTRPHKTAQSLGAKPFHFAQLQTQIQASADAESAVVSGPRASRLRAVEGEYTVKPKKPGGWLAFPAHSSTYGRRAAELRGQTEFGFVKGVGRVLKFKGTEIIAFVLRRKATIPADRTILPDDQAYRDTAIGAILRRLKSALPQGGVA